MHTYLNTIVYVSLQEGETAMDLAKVEGHTDIVDLLIQFRHTH